MSRLLSDKLNMFFTYLLLAWVSFLPNNIQESYRPFFFIAMALFLIHTLAQKRFRLKEYFFKKTDLLVWSYLFLMTFSVWNSFNIMESVIFYRNFSLFAVLIYFPLKNYIEMSNLKKVLRTLCIFALFVSLFGLFEVTARWNPLYPPDSYFYFSYIGFRMMSTLVHPNIVGGYLLPCVFLSFYMVKSSLSRAKKLLWFAVFVIILISVVFTFSRGTILAGLLVLSVILLVTRKVKFIAVVWTTVLLFSILLMCIYSNRPMGKSYPDILPDYSYHLGSRFSVDRLADYALTSHRTINYFVTFSMLSRHPITGVGLNNYRAVLDLYSNKLLNYEVKIPDSIYLWHLAESGLIGFLGLVLLLLNVLLPTVKSFNNLNGDDKRLSLAVFYAFCALLVNMGTYDGFLWQTPLCLFWIFYAILAKLNEVISAR